MADPLAQSSKFVNALSESHERAVRVDVYQGNTFLQTLTQVISGSVVVDQTATTRRTCSLVLQDVGKTASTSSLVPNVAGDLLHPLSGNELHIFRGITYADGTQDMAQLGVFRMTQPQITDTGDGIQITITGNDRSWEITKFKWTQPYQVAANQDLAATVQAILINRWNGPTALSFAITPTSPVPAGYPGAGTYVSVPTTTFGSDLANNNDPWTDVLSLASAAGFELFFNPSGVVVMQPIINPTTVAVVFSDLYEEGDDCLLTEVERVLDESSTYSGCIAIGTGTAGGLPPVQSQSVSPANGQTYQGVWNTNPASPTYYDPGNPSASNVGPVPYIFETQAIPGYQSVPFTGTITINTATITGCTVPGGSPALTTMVVGSPVTGPGIPSGTTVVSAIGTTVTMSANATASSTAPASCVGGGAPDTQQTAQVKINAAATAQLQLILQAFDAVTLTTVPNPALWENDVIEVIRARLGITSSYAVSGMTIPLDATSTMSITLKPQLQPS